MDGLGVQLEKVKPSNKRGSKSVDCRSIGDGPEHVVEVKELTSPDFRNANAAADSARFISARLNCQWTVVLNTPALSEALAPPPDFRDPTPEEVRESEARGFHVMSAEERRREWIAAHPVRRSVPRLKDLGRRLEPYLLALEQHDILDTRGRSWWAHQNREVAKALRYIAQRTNGAVCQGFPVLADRRGGVTVQRAWGSLRTGQPNTLVTRIEAWFEAGFGTNLIESLATETGAVRHAVLVFDSTEPEGQAAIDQGLNFCPSEALALPDVIDVLWFILGPVACRFMVGDGWTSFPVPASAT
jgi:hypothetical protein